MGKPNTKCRVCGKEYFCCADSKKINSWRTMACSIECYKEYMDRIEKSRKSVHEVDIKTSNNEVADISKVKGRKRKTVDSEEVSENIIIED